jgi:carboxyl-terminal processing protease
MNDKSPFLFSGGGLFFLAAAFFIPFWIYSKNPLFMMRGDLDAKQVAMVADHISKNYMEPVSTEELMRHAVRGMTEHLDPWTKYIEAQSDEKRDLEELSGNFVGIGIMMQPLAVGKGIEVAVVFPKSPAEKSGVKKGDIFREVDGVSLDGQTNLSHLGKLVQGKEGTVVTIKFYRPAIADNVTLKITRTKMESPSVTAEELPGDVLYLKLRLFHAKSAAQIKDKLLKHPKSRALILDLRSNGGGVLEGAVDIACFFLKKGQLVVSVESRDSSHKEYCQTDGAWKDLPMAILIDRWSASASEILVGALQDHGRAVIYGEKSYGKGLVQQVFPLEDGKAGLKLTTGRYRTPKGHFLHRTPEKPYGIVPDVEISVDYLSDEYYKKMLKISWQKLGIKKDFDTFIKENPIEKKPSGVKAALVTRVHQDLLKKIK